MAEQCLLIRLTAAGVVGDSGQPIDVAAVNVEAGGGGAAVPTLLNGTTSGGTLLWKLPSTASSTQGLYSVNLPGRFTKGCYVTFDGNTSAVTVWYIQATSA